MLVIQGVLSSRPRVPLSGLDASVGLLCWGSSPWGFKARWVEALRVRPSSRWGSSVRVEMAILGLGLCVREGGAPPLLAAHVTTQKDGLEALSAIAAIVDVQAVKLTLPALASPVVAVHHRSRHAYPSLRVGRCLTGGPI